MSRRLVFAVAALATTSAEADAGVIVVDPAGIGEPALQAAIDAAADGDIILLQPGDYELNGTGAGVLIDGKGLTLVGDGSAPDLCRVVVANVPAGATVVLRGIRVESPAVHLPGVAVLDCAGTLWIEDCSLVGGIGAFSQPGGPALLLDEAEAVVVMRSELTGGAGNNECLSILCNALATEGGAGALVLDSRAAFHACRLEGGRGGNEAQVWCFGFAKEGGPGLKASGSHVVLSGSDVAGGQGGQGCSSAPVGGDGLVGDAGSQIWIQDSVFTGGIGSGGVGTDIVVPAGSQVAFPSAARVIAVSAPLREGEPGELTIGAEVGDFAGFFWSFDGGWIPLEGKQGVFSLGAPFQGLFLLGVVPSDPWTLAFTAPALPPAAQGFAHLMQLWVRDSETLKILAGGTTVLVIVDAGF